MAYLAGDGGSGEGKINYPCETMCTAAIKIMVDADLALSAHETNWAKIQAFVQTFPDFMQSTALEVLNPYEKRLRDSYQWQKDFGSALQAAAGTMQTSDKDISYGFQYTPKGSNMHVS